MGRPLKFRALPGVLAALVALSVSLSACGDEAGKDTDTSASQSDSGKYGPNEPDSADDSRPDAPDDKISDRPGGPNDDSAETQVNP